MTSKSELKRLATVDPIGTAYRVARLEKALVKAIEAMEFSGLKIAVEPSGALTHEAHLKIIRAIDTAKEALSNEKGKTK